MPRKLRTAAERLASERRAERLSKARQKRRHKADKAFWKDKAAAKACAGFEVPPHKLTEKEIEGKEVGEIHKLKFDCRMVTKHPSGLCRHCLLRQELREQANIEDRGRSGRGYVNPETKHWMRIEGFSYGNLLRARRKLLK